MFLLLLGATDYDPSSSAGAANARKRSPRTDPLLATALGHADVDASAADRAALRRAGWTLLITTNNARSSVATTTIVTIYTALPTFIRDRVRTATGYGITRAGAVAGIRCGAALGGHGDAISTRTLI
jgi:hypothetical protein